MAKLAPSTVQQRSCAFGGHLILKTCPTIPNSKANYSVFISLSREPQRGGEVRGRTRNQYLSPTSKPESKRVKYYYLYCLVPVVQVAVGDGVYVLLFLLGYSWETEGHTLVGL